MYIKQLLIILILTIPNAGNSLELVGDKKQQGHTIMAAVEKMNTGFISQTADMTMTLTNKYGKTNTRYIRTRILEGTDTGDRSLSIFDSPADVRGTIVLTHSKGRESDDQWLYLPALKRVKRISSKNQSGPYVGSEFSYEDIGPFEIEKYDYQLLEKNEEGGRTNYIVERTPLYQHSGYTRQLVWVDSERFVINKIEYYDKKNQHFKTLTSSGFHLYKDRFWRAQSMLMENNQTGKSTLLSWDNYQFDVEINSSEFSHQALQRIR